MYTRRERFRLTYTYHVHIHRRRTLVLHLFARTRAFSVNAHSGPAFRSCNTREVVV
jgi:hypothetical protein